MKKIVCRYRVSFHSSTLENLVKIGCLKVTEVHSLLTNYKKVQYINSKMHYVGTIKLEWSYYLVFQRVVEVH